MIRIVVLLSALSGVAACAVYSHEPGEDEPHAVVLFEEKKAVEGFTVVRETTPQAIDGKDINEWSRWDFDRIRVKPGPVAITTIASVSNGYVSYATLEFEAIAGETYSIGGDALKTEVRFYVKDSGDNELTSVIEIMELNRNSQPVVIPIFMP